jgi:hypothetical protein
MSSEGLEWAFRLYPWGGSGQGAVGSKCHHRPLPATNWDSATRLNTAVFSSIRFATMRDEPRVPRHTDRHSRHRWPSTPTVAHVATFEPMLNTGLTETPATSGPTLATSTPPSPVKMSGLPTTFTVGTTKPSG